MAKKKRTPKQLAADKARSEIMKQRLAEPEEVVYEKTDFQEPSDNEQILTLIKEIQDENRLLKAAFLGNQASQGGQIGVDRGKLVGEVDKYVIDPANYEDPTARLAKEPRLKAVNFDYNYELEYDFGLSKYETKTGINMKEPKFTIQLLRIKLDDQGAQTNVRYIARRLIFHEDPQAAIIIARENGLEVDENNQKQFLNEMRYLRVRDWLFGYFWPKPVDEKGKIHEEVLDGTIVQVFTKSSEDASEIPFERLKKKLV